MPKNVFQPGVQKTGGDVLTDDDVNDLSSFGDGSDGSYTSGDNLDPGKVYNFTDFTLNQGDNLQSTASNSGEPIIIKVQGDVDISGTIDLKGQGYSAGSGFTRFGVAFGTPGDNSDNDNSNSGGRKYPEEFLFSHQNLMVLSGTGGASGRTASDNAAAGGGGGASYGADGGSSNAGAKNTNTTGSGGAGGGSMIILAGGNLDFSGTIDIRGDDGQDAGGAGGGGGGGMFWGLYNGALTDNGTKLSSGGSGGNGDEGDGGNGASGTIIIEEVS